MKGLTRLVAIFTLLFLLWVVTVLYFNTVDYIKPSLRRVASETKKPCNHLIVVAGHAVVKINGVHAADVLDSSWYLLSYQMNQGYPGIITSHIKTGIQIANADDRSILIFSGGQTRKNVGPISEASSYYYVAEDKNWVSPSVKSRLFLEEFARDSFENLLFSVCRFREVTGSYPSNITVIGFDFKKYRFTDLHREAIGFPLANFSYVGLRANPRYFNQERAKRGEVYATKSFEMDRYGCSDSSLRDKRDIRNPFRRTVPYMLACPELKELLRWCRKDLYNDIDALPWNSNAPMDAVAPPIPHTYRTAPYRTAIGDIYDIESVFQDNVD